MQSECELIDPVADCDADTDDGGKNRCRINYRTNAPARLRSKYSGKG